MFYFGTQSYTEESQFVPIFRESYAPLKIPLVFPLFQGGNYSKSDRYPNISSSDTSIFQYNNITLNELPVPLLTKGGQVGFGVTKGGFVTFELFFSQK